MVNNLTIMKYTIRLFYLLIISLPFYSCADNAITPPDYLDQGKAVDSLKKVYNCETIEFNNWGDKQASDSCLTVCLVNSTKVPLGSNVDNSVDQFTGIASVIKKSLAKPQTYKTFYIIFVKKQNVNGIEIKSHSAGMEVPTREI